MNNLTFIINIYKSKAFETIILKHDKYTYKKYKQPTKSLIITIICRAYTYKSLKSSISPKYLKDKTNLKMLIIKEIFNKQHLLKIIYDLKDVDANPSTLKIKLTDKISILAAYQLDEYIKKAKLDYK